MNKNYILVGNSRYTVFQLNTDFQLLFFIYNFLSDHLKIPVFVGSCGANAHELGVNPLLMYQVPVVRDVKQKSIYFMFMDTSR